MQLRISSFFIVAAVTAANLIFWIFSNLPVLPEESSYPVEGLSYNPFQRDQSPFRGDTPALKDISQDLDILAQRTQSIRLYSSRGLEEVPRLAAQRGLSVIASAWLGSDPTENQKEVGAVIQLAQSNPNVTRVLIGNETQLKNLVPRAELLEYLRAARKTLKIPVSTAEPWDFWLNHPELVAEVDFLAVHILPYWMEIPVEDAIDYTLDRFHLVRKQYPDKFAMIAEAGWPSAGPQKGGAEASQAEQALYLREFIRRARKEHIAYNIIEAFDQPWKSATEGRAGEHFGILDAYRADKFPISGPVLNERGWEAWAISSVIIGFIVMTFFLMRRPRIRIHARLFAAILIQAAVTTGVELARRAAGEYMSTGDIVFWTVMVAAQALLAVIFLSDTAEIADVVGGEKLHRKFGPACPSPSRTEWPMVSIHVACCREPPEMVIATMESLARLDYPNFEVLIIDNNTPDENLWRPLERRCQELGPRFRFFTLGKWPGFKAGALNFGLRQTNPDAVVVGVVDADYVVEPDWLKGTIPYFDDSEVSLVQAPQEHRDVERNLFQLMEADEYCGFFRIGMVQRNEDNAIVQHGTMTLIRRTELDALNGWAEWCICEDTELGIRLLLRKTKSVYIDHIFGRGLAPDSYEAYAKQRFRWAYGGMRIFRRYWREVFGIQPGLDAGQRYQFLKGWLPWIGDGLHMFFTTCALIWSALLLWKPLETDFPEPIFIYPAVALVGLRIVGTAWTYAIRVRIGSERTLLAMLAGGSLTHTIAKAVVLGLLTGSKPFYRTPKMENVPRLVQSLLSVYQEFSLALLLFSMAAGIIVVFGVANDSAVLWAIALLAQSLPYVAAVGAAFVSSLDRHSAARLAGRLVKV